MDNIKAFLKGAREWAGLLAALLAGPIFIMIVHAGHLIYSIAGAAIFLYCGAVVPLIAFAAGRFKFFAWPLAVISLVVAVIQDNRSAGIQMHGRELFTTVCAFGFLGTLISSPLLIYYRLKPLPMRRRIVEGATIVAIAIVFAIVLVLLDPK